MSDRALIIYCGLLMSLSAFSIDITLPFFRVMADSLAAPMPSIQATVTVYIFALGVGQITFGPLSDKVGRRPTIAAGLCVYLVGALVTFFAPTVEWVLAGRLLQGVGGAAGPVVARAIIRDRSSGVAMAKNMALATGIFSFGPIFAPLIGVAIAAIGGTWRAVFVAMFAFGVILLVALLRAPETIAARNPDALRPSTLAANARALFAHPQSRHFMFVTAIGTSLMVSIIAGVPRIYENEFDVTGAAFAVLFALHGLGIIIGQYFNHRLIGRIGVVRTAILAAAVLIAGSLGILLFALFGWLTAISLTGLLVLFAVGFLIVMANAGAMVLDPHGRIAGFTASFLGCFAQVTGSALATLVSVLTAGRVAPLAAYLVAASSVICLALIWWRRREG